MLEFEIKNQTIKRIDRFNPATDSVDYLTAKFNFLTADWDGYSKTAIFKAGTESYSVVIKNNSCKVPYEVLVASEKSRSQLVGNNKIFVSVFGTKGTSRVPTNETRIYLETSGYTEGKTPEAPKADVYAQILDGQAEIREELTERANALKGNASGEIVRVNDVSPVEHKARAKVHGKNLIPYPYYKNSQTVAGGTFTALEDGGISGSGTPTAYCDMYMYQGKPLADSGKITLSLSGTYTNMVVMLAIYNGAGNELIARNCEKSPICLTLDEYPDATKWLILIKRKTDNVTMSGTAYLQIELGDTATEYEPYLDPSSVTVTRYGADETDNPATYTPDTNGNCEITSLAPTMTLITDTAGVTIDLEYNKDINAENEAVRADITELDRITGEHTTLLGDVETALDNIIAIQTGLIGG